MRNPFVVAALMAASMMQSIPPAVRRQMRQEHSTKRAKPASYYKPNGEQECARRRRQIAKSMIKVSP